MRPVCDLNAMSHWDMNATLSESRQVTQLRSYCDIAMGHECDFYPKVAVGHNCDLIAISHLDIDATLYESRCGAQMRPHCDIALGYECDIKTALHESHQKT